MTDADVIVVGAGAVGLHAALKTAALRQSVIVVDKGRRFSRVVQAPAIANIPGAPGISGAKLLDMLRADLTRLAEISGEKLVRVLDDTDALDVRRDGERGEFALRVRAADGAERELRSRVLVLATGLVDRKPGIETYEDRGHTTLAPFYHRSGFGWCLLCEGWDLHERAVAIVGCSDDSASIAADVAAHFGGRATLLTDAAPLEGGDAAREKLREARVAIDERAVKGYEPSGDGVSVQFGDESSARFDKVLFTLGHYRVNNELAVKLGGATTPEGYVRTDENSEVLDANGSRIPGLFAVGDVRADRWKQVVIGWGDAETAIITAYTKRLP